MDIWSRFSGAVRIRVTTADPERFINEALENGIDLYDIHYTNDLDVTGKIHRKSYKKLKALAQHRGNDVRNEGSIGAYFRGKQTVLRPVFLCTFLLVLLLAVFLPTRVYFVRVEGNSRLPERLILAYAEECGIRFGAKRSLVRSEKMKNMLLEVLPELQWAGINTKGCTAVISVREKDTVDEAAQSSGVSSIVASCDGVIEQCTVIRGNALCKVGDAVQEGQVLVSGYTDCGLSILATRAEAEIFAKTIRKLEVYSLAKCEQRGDARDSTVRISLIIGKKQINFYKDSGISHSSCVKMREELCLTLPGGFRLPVTVVKEHITSYDTGNEMLDSCTWADAFAKAYLQKEMLSGSILSEECSIRPDGEVFVHSGTYHCFEMIGMQKDEEIIR